MGSKNKNLSANNCKTKQKQRPKYELHLLIICIISVIMVSLSIGIYAWARYSTIGSGSAQAQVAKWNFELKLKSGDQEVTEGSGVLDLAKTLSYDHVAEDKIAPGTEGEFKVIIDTTGTEVDMFYDVIINITDCPHNLIFKRVDENNVETLLSGGEQTSLTRTLSFSKYLKVNPTNENRVHEETIKWEWPYETGTTDEEIAVNDDIDTLDEGRTVQMRISVRGTEVMNTPFTDSGLTYGDGETTGTEIVDGGNINLEIGATTTLSKALGTENVTYSSSDTTVATVSSAGVIEAVKAGTSVITVTGTESGSAMQITLEVTKPEVKVGDTITYQTSLNGQNLTEWKVFYKDEEHDKVYLILADYMPNSVLKDGSNNSIIPNLSFSGTYNVYSSSPRANLINAMTTRANWASLLKGTINGKSFDYSSNDYNGTYDAMGSPTLDLYVQSWNAKYPNNDTYPTNEIYTGKRTGMSDTIGWGYYVSRTNKTPTSTSVNMSGSEGYKSAAEADKLYYPHAGTSDWNSCYGYWLASPSANLTNSVMRVYYDGRVSYSSYSYTYYAFRPLVCLPSSVLE